MKKTLALITMIILINNILYWQKPKNFAFLFSGEKIYSTNVEYVQKSFSKSYFLVAKEKIANKNVKFYKTNSGFFANTINLNFTGETSFAKREVKGNMNLFKKRIRFKYYDDGSKWNDGKYGTKLLCWLLL